ncbi:MAG: M56 family metallopeptidase [Muribaculaceae bacterium]|nr:M56 family metallopeptidase [Muribaculaceae bacterium]
MPSLFAYSLYSGLFLLAGYLAYRALLASEKQPSLNRAALLGLYVVALLALPVAAGLAALRPVHVAPAGVAIDLTAIAVAVADAPRAQWQEWLPMVVWAYAAGAAAVVLRTLWGYGRLVQLIVRGRHERRDDYTLVVLPEAVVPFSFMHYIVIGEADSCRADMMVTAHELGHLRCRHWIDLVLAQAVCALMWYNPAAWLMRSELRRVHEYQADAAVLGSGFDARSYQMLLIEKAAGVRLQSLANSLDHSNLSKRITMMYKQNNGAARRLRVLALVPALVLAAFAAGQPAVAATLSAVKSLTMAAAPAATASAAATIDSKVTEKTETAQPRPAQLPRYKGGEGAMFSYLAGNIRYPEEAVKAGKQGRVLVKFTVQPDGRVTDVEIERGVDPALDKEAVRVISAMPAWEPGLDEAGKPVACAYALPVTFKLAGGEKSKTEEPKAALVAVAGEKGDKATADGAELDNVVVIGYNGIAKVATEKPVIFIGGTLYEGDLSSIDPNRIESITIRKDDPKYPTGVVDITLKEKNQ